MCSRTSKLNANFYEGNTARGFSNTFLDLNSMTHSYFTYIIPEITYWLLMHITSTITAFIIFFFILLLYIVVPYFSEFYLLSITTTSRFIKVLQFLKHRLSTSGLFFYLVPYLLGKLRVPLLPFEVGNPKNERFKIGTTRLERVKVLRLVWS